MSVAENIKKIIHEKGLFQHKVAESAGISKNRFSSMLNGTTKIKTSDVVPICEALHISPNELFDLAYQSTERAKMSLNDYKIYSLKMISGIEDIKTAKLIYSFISGMYAKSKVERR